MTSYEVIAEEGRAPIKLWTRGVDETPGAYKNVEDVMNAQADLVEIVHTLKQVVCVKG